MGMERGRCASERAARERERGRGEESVEGIVEGSSALEEERGLRLAGAGEDQRERNLDERRVRTI